MIRRSLLPTNKMAPGRFGVVRRVEVGDLIRIEREYINVDHPDFIGGLKAMSRVRETRLESSPRVPAPAPQQETDVIRLPPVPLVVVPTGEPSEKEHMDTELLKSLLQSYFTIVKRTFAKRKRPL